MSQQYNDPYEEPYADAPADEANEPYAVDDDYSAYNEELDNSHRFHIAMNVFDTISVIAGVAIALILVALLAGLISWLRTDITHSFTLLQSQIK